MKIIANTSFAVLLLSAACASAQQDNDAGAPANHPPQHFALQAPTSNEDVGPRGGGDDGDAQFPPPRGRSRSRQVILGHPPGQPGDGEAMGRFFRNVGPTEKPLYIPNAAVGDTIRTEVEEDLNIMGKLLDDAILGESKPGPQAMGINIGYSIFGGAPAARRVQLDGYGAVFQATVNFPLADPSAKSDVTKTNAPTNSAWDQARQEIYGGLAPGAGAGGLPAPEPPAYSAEKVDNLKRSILKALANAPNMRHLKSEESITVVVRSSGNDGFGRFIGSTVAYALSADRNVAAAAVKGAPESILIVRIKKADAESYAKAKSRGDSDSAFKQFEKKAVVLFE